MIALDETHDPSLRSWVDAANEPDADFPIQNLPFGMFRRRGKDEAIPGVAIGDRIIDLPLLASRGLLQGKAAKAVQAFRNGPLNNLMALGREYWVALRLDLSRLLREGASRQGDTAAGLVLMSDAEMLLPAQIGDFTDFYSSIHHATNAGSLFRPDNPLLPNYRWVPIAYHGRSSSVKVSGTPLRRPLGQSMPKVAGKDSAAPIFGPTKRLDIELELGCYIGPGNALGEPIALAGAEAHLFGLSLLNDWSARDIQAWEYQPLGPFLGKNFLTTVSPWVVTMEALAPFRIQSARPAADALPDYLRDSADQQQGGLDITLEVLLQSASMREQGMAPHRIARAPFASQYWTVFQLITHHASNGCNLQPGDLLGTGTISGPAPGEQGCLLEMSVGGSKPFTLPSGESRTFLEDGDEVTLRAFCQRAGATRIGFGECVGRVEPARS